MIDAFIHGDSGDLFILFVILDVTKHVPFLDVSSPDLSLYTTVFHKHMFLMLLYNLSKNRKYFIYKHFHFICYNKYCSYLHYVNKYNFLLFF